MCDKKFIDEAVMRWVLDRLEQMKKLDAGLKITPELLQRLIDEAKVTRNGAH